MTNRRPNSGISWGVPQLDTVNQQTMGFARGLRPTFGNRRSIPIDPTFDMNPKGPRIPNVRPGGPAPQPSRSPWDLDEDSWDVGLGEPEIDRGMGNIIDRRPNDRDWWQDRMADIRGQANTVDPSRDWGDDDWMDVYEPGDAVQVKADGNPNFGKAWDGDSWEDIDPNDASVASMFAESEGWDDDYQQGLKEAWANNDETAFQRWRNLARAYQTSQWQGQPSPTQPDQRVSIPPMRGKPKPKAPTPTVPTPPTGQPDPWPKKQRPIY